MIKLKPSEICKGLSVEIRLKLSSYRRQKGRSVCKISLVVLGGLVKKTYFMKGRLKWRFQLM
jgi:hypothetical protein